ncbi:tryptophan 2,3-dioxygenase [Flavisphingomonas formosensis]|uniref:tryptophan 2,3-dioxygenase n=1 Tax=Flavisphingomonas formosensis TaxID=861534 RepID=UPI0018DFE03F|nr:tryptophan 2,3-dioxygenase family protein [Sphingomonas formosensis]
MRDIGVTTDESREKMVSQTVGEPLVEFAGESNPYIDYHRNDLLHSLQHMRSDAYAELPFILMTQVKELLFRAVHYEFFNMQARIREDDVVGMLDLVPRATREVELVIKTWDVLSTITAADFNGFRNHLGTSSGQQSYAYRHVEFILGNKSAILADAHANNPDVYPQMLAALNGPSLYDDVLALMARRGFAIPQDRLDRDWSQAYQPSGAVEDAWLQVYAEPVPENDLYRVAEALITIDDLFTQYRWRHFVSVQRILGLKPGTGGSAGVGWLRHVTELRFFPELWSLRTRLHA